MTDAHCHLRGDAARHFLCAPLAADGALPQSDDVLFVGCHPWYLKDYDGAVLRAALVANPRLGVGEIGLDRLRDRVIAPRMRTVFEEQLRLAAELKRPVVLHGAKCWGEVVVALAALAVRPPAALFHGFSRSEGLVPQIVALNGYVSVSPAILNDHAVNYRELVRRLPRERMLVETDRTAENAAKVPPMADLVVALAALLSTPQDILVAQLESNADDFIRT